MDRPLTKPDDVLAQRTRARLFELLAEIKRPAGTDELAERLGMHPNGVRLHLERMQDAGLLTREQVRQPVGRPRDAWSIDPDARPGGEPPRAYVDLGRWMARVVASGRRGMRGVEEVGREIGREIAPRDGEAGAEEAMFSSLAALGFDPQRQPRKHGAAYCLGNCPYRDAVRESGRVVCTLHRGLTRGMLDVLAPGAKLAGFEPHDPDEAGCLVELRGLEPHDA